VEIILIYILKGRMLKELIEKTLIVLQKKMNFSEEFLITLNSMDKIMILLPETPNIKEPILLQLLKISEI
jgi:hypothetical protein